MDYERGDFFAVDCECFHRAFDGGGVNAALAYLVLAAGTGGDNRTTRWSAEAIKKRTRLSWRTCRSAIDRLILLRLIDRVGGGGRKPPAYVFRLPDAPHWIWLPGSLVDVDASPRAPIETVRESGVPAAMRLLVDLYDAQSLPDFGGVHWHQLRESYHRTRHAESGPYVIWGFDRGEIEYRVSAPFVYAGWREALDVLLRAGLVSFVEHLIDAFDPKDTEVGAILYPCAKRSGEKAERRVGEAATRAACALLPDFFNARIAERGGGDVLLPELRHRTGVQVVGVLRLRHRARTSATAQWLARFEEWDAIASELDIIADEAERKRANVFSFPGRHQRADIKGASTVFQSDINESSCRTGGSRR